jgi:hypothetical protein
MAIRRGVASYAKIAVSGRQNQPQLVPFDVTSYRLFHQFSL